MARLLYRSDSGEPMTFEFGPEHPEVVIGRHKACDIITVDSTVSRRHAKIVWMDGSVQLTDLGSSNGTFFDGQRITEHWLDDADEFTCGAFPVQFYADAAENALTGEALADDEILDAEPIEAEPVDLPPPPPARPEPAKGQPASPTRAPEAVGAALVDALDSPRTGIGLPVGPASTSGGPPPAVAVPWPEPVPAEPEPEYRPTRPAQPESAVAAFSEFNRHLEEKERQVQGLREQLREREDRLAILEAERSGLADALETERATGVSTGEFGLLSAQNEQLTAKNAQLEAGRAELEQRLSSLQAQILRVQENQPSERDVARLKEAAAERDRLWEQREALEARYMALKRQLRGEDATDGGGADDDDEALAKGLSARLQAAQEDLADALERITGMDLTLQDAEARATDAEAAATAAQNRMEALSDDLLRMENRIDELENRPTVDDLAAARADASRLSSDLAALVAERASDAAASSATVSRIETDLVAARSAAVTLQGELERERAEAARARAAASDRSELSALEARLAIAEAGVLRERRTAEERQAEVEGLRTQISLRERDLVELRQRGVALERDNGELKEMVATLPDRETVRGLERQRDTAHHEKETALSERSRLETEAASLRTRVQELDRRLEARERDAGVELKRVDGERLAALQRVASLEGKVREVEDVLVTTPSRTEVEELRGRIAAIERERDAAVGRADAVERRSRDLERELDALRTALKTAETAASDGRSRERALEATADTAKVQLQELQRTVEGLRASSSDRDSKQAALDGRIAELQKQVQALEAARLAAASDLASARDAEKREMDRARAAEAALDTARTKLTELNATSDEKDSLLALNRNLHKQVAQLKKQVQDASTGSEVAAETATRITALERDAARVSVLERDLNEARSALAAATNDASAARSELDGARTRIAAAEAEQRRVTARAESLAAEIKSLESKPGAADTGNGAVDVLATQVTKVIDELNDRLSALRNNDETVQFCVQ
ncbi:MAG: FHA domain-containing protein, partial [Myxococcales bacterium]|nr:FHA domain-containing protein [Myxococcales bacterium]